MADQFVGEIRAFGFYFAPYDWASCNGQTLSVFQNQLLYAVIGSKYGGDAKNFKLPDLGGRAVMGQVGGNINNPLGEATVTINPSQMPAHSHGIFVNIARATTAQPVTHMPARFLDQNNNAFIPANPRPDMTTLSPVVVGPVGSNLHHDNCQPYQVLNFCIALTGAWPERP